MPAAAAAAAAAGSTAAPPRPEPAYSPLPELASTFVLRAQMRNYNHQYANMYFARLVQLRAAVQAEAERKWAKAAGQPKLVDRVLDVQQGQLCYILGTVYMDMPLKPNVLEDITKDKWIVAPPPRQKFFSDEDTVVLEDESGRVQLVGARLASETLVTGVILAALGYESSAGDFEVVDFCYAGIPSHAPPVAPLSAAETDKMIVDGEEAAEGSWLAFVSGLEVQGGDAVADLRVQLLVEYLMGEAAGSEDSQLGGSVSRLVLAGNSLAAPAKVDPEKQKIYGYDPSSYTTLPISALDEVLSTIAPLLPIHLLPGPTDPSGQTLPQQPLPRLMFKQASAWPGFVANTNPAWFSSGPASVLATSGQAVDDMFKYVPGGDDEGDDTRLELAQKTLEWRSMAPTAPDTLWCHPFDDSDPFLLTAAPDIYVVGNQPHFDTCLATNAAGERTRVVLLPRFAQSGTLVLVHSATLEVRTIDFDVAGWEEEAIAMGAGAGSEEAGSSAPS